MRIILYDDVLRYQFRPLSDTRPLAELRCGCFTMRERVERLASAPVELWAPEVIADAVRGDLAPRPLNVPLTGPALLLSGRAAWSAIPTATGDDSWVGIDAAGAVVCVYTGADWAHPLFALNAPLDPAWELRVLDLLPWRDVTPLVRNHRWPWDLIAANSAQLAEDARHFTLGASAESQPGAHLLAPERIHLGEGVRLLPTVVIDAESGPVVIGAGTRLLPHAYIQGPAYIGPNCLIQAGAVLRCGVAIGPVCKIGGEVEGSLIQGYSNKQHDGFLGHSYVGSWVNIAADCINSDLKNTYGTIRMAIGGEAVETGQQFLGMVVGDHAKLGINCAVPTGAVVGTGSSIVGPRAPIHTGAFEWVDGEVREPYDLGRAMAVAAKVMGRRGRSFGPAEMRLFAQLHAETWGGAAGFEASTG